MEKRVQILDLYYDLQKEIQKLMGKKAVQSGSVITKYAKTLSKEKREILEAIRDFRNVCAFSSNEPKLPSNHQEWIDFLNNEITMLKSKNLK